MNYFAILLNSCHGAKRLPGTPRSVFTSQPLLALSGRLGGKGHCDRSRFVLLDFHVASGRCGGRTRRHCAPGPGLGAPQRLSEGDAHSAVLSQRHCYKNIPPRVYRSSRTRQPRPRGRHSEIIPCIIMEHLPPSVLGLTFFFFVRNVFRACNFHLFYKLIN